MCVGMCVGICVGMYVGMCVNMYVGMCVNMYVGMCVNTYVGMCVNMYVGMCVNTYVGMCVNMYVGMCVSMCVNMYVGMCVNMYVGMCVDYVTWGVMRLSFKSTHLHTPGVDHVTISPLGLRCLVADMGSDAAFNNINPLTLMQHYIRSNNLRLVDLFKQFDKNHTGTVSRDEFVGGLRVR